MSQPAYQIILLQPGSDRPAVAEADRVVFDAADLAIVAATLEEGASCAYVNPSPAMLVTVSHRSAEEMSETATEPSEEPAPLSAHPGTSDVDRCAPVAVVANGIGGL